MASPANAGLEALGATVAFEIAVLEEDIAVMELIEDPALVLDLKAVELHHEPISIDQAFVVGAAVVATEAEQLLVPTAAGLDVSGTDERLRVHVPTLFQRGVANSD